MSKRSPTKGEEGISPRALSHGLADEPDRIAEAKRLPAPSTAEVISALSEGLDLAEGRAMGHAERVCYIATSLARSLDLSAQEQIDVYYASLLHDVGIPIASARLSHLTGINEDTLFAASPRKAPEELAAECCSTELPAVMMAFHQHTAAGRDTVEALGFSKEAAEAVGNSHEHWNGSGYPEGLAAHDIPLAARILCLADWAESIVADEASSLAARRQLMPELQLIAETVLDPHLLAQFEELCRSDDFWLGLYSNDLSRFLLAAKPHENGRSNRRSVAKVIEAFSKVIDAKSPYIEGKSVRVAGVSVQLAEAIGYSPDHVAAVHLAALLHDVGQLGVPARILAKTDILSVTEMQLLHRHPSYSRLTLEGLKGFEEISLWVGAHHERPDGKGYPEMLTGDLIPLESRLISVADTYVALTSDRPYRKALSGRDAAKVLRGTAGTQLDASLVRVLCQLI